MSEEGAEGVRAAGLRTLLLGPPLGIRELRKEQINPVEGLPALSLDALTSVAYGPQAMLVVLGTAGLAALHLVVPITVAIVVLLAVLVVSYHQVIEAYPGGGGAYAVSRDNLGRSVSQLAAAALVVDYTLTVAVSISAGVESLVSAFPALKADTVPLCLGILALITLLNLRGLGDSARAFLLPTLVFVVGLLAIIVIGLIHPLGTKSPPPGTSLVATHDLAAVGILLVLKAFSAGCSALTGVEAIANGVPQFKEPRVKRAKVTETMLGVILGALLIGLAVLADRFHAAPSSSQTVLSEIMGASIGRNWAYYAMSITITVVLALAANTSFGGMPILGSLLARDNYVPHAFSLRDDRLTFGTGIWVLAALAGVLLVVTAGNTNDLIPLFAIGVFIGFTLAQGGLVVYWRRHRPPRWRRRAAVNGFGAVVTGASAIIFLLTKFAEGAWVVVVAIPLFIFVFRRVEAYYGEVSRDLRIGQVPPPPLVREVTVVVPITGLSQMTWRAVSEGRSLGREVVALHVVFEDEAADARIAELTRQWDDWDPGARLEILRTEYASVVRPIVAYIDRLRRQECQVVVLIPVLQPSRLRQHVLHNHMDLALTSVLRRRSDITVARVTTKAVRRPRRRRDPGVGHHPKVPPGGGEPGPLGSVGAGVDGYGDRLGPARREQL